MERKLKILFVDDEYDVIAGLKRALHLYHKSWDMHFASGGRDAINVLKSSDFDIIFCDIVMPEIDGIQVLKYVFENKPQIIRFVLSGHSNIDSIVKSTKYAHQFLSKPVSSKILVEKIKQVEKSISFLDSEEEFDLIRNYKDSPFNSKIYLKLQKEMEKENINFNAITNIIKSDPFIAGKILQIANSGFFALYKEISSISEAIKYIGLNNVKKLILFFHTFNLNIDNQKIKQSLNKITQESLALAYKMISLANALKLKSIKSDEAFVVGLLALIGKIILITNNMNENSKFEHFSAYILAVWGIPEAIYYSIFFFDDPLNESNNYKELSSLLYICRFIDTLQKAGQLNDIDVINGDELFDKLITNFDMKKEFIHKDFDSEIFYQQFMKKIR